MGLGKIVQPCCGASEEAEDVVFIMACVKHLLSSFLGECDLVSVRCRDVAGSFLGDRLLGWEKG